MPCSRKNTCVSGSWKRLETASLQIFKNSSRFADRNGHKLHATCWLSLWGHAELSNAEVVSLYEARADNGIVGPLHRDA